MWVRRRCTQTCVRQRNPSNQACINEKSKACCTFGNEPATQATRPTTILKPISPKRYISRTVFSRHISTFFYQRRRSAELCTAVIRHLDLRHTTRRPSAQTPIVKLCWKQTLPAPPLRQRPASSSEQGRQRRAGAGAGWGIDGELSGDI